VTDKNPANNAPDAVSHIEQHWSPPDASVRVPFPPGVIAPISGLDQVLLYRMLEESVAARLKFAPIAQPKPAVVPAALMAPALAASATDAITSREYVVRRTTAPIKIDGVLDEPSWKQAVGSGSFTVYNPSDVDRHTEAKLLWDNDRLYIAVTCIDPDVRASRMHRDDDVFNEDCVEFFIMEQHFKERFNHFLEYQINALGTRTDAYNVATYAGIVGWDSAGWQSAVKVDGTLNNAADKDRGWVVEMAIAFKDLHAILYRTEEVARKHMGKEFQGFMPKPGDKWRANIYRLKYTAKGTEYQAWSPIDIRMAFHDLPHFGTLVFSDQPAGAA